MKEDDMDEMLRRAADNYEVDADKAADWDAVYAVVHEADIAVPVTEKKRRRLFAFWWLLLIPLGWIAHTEYSNLKTQPEQTQTTQVVTPQIKPNNSRNNTVSSTANTSPNNTLPNKNIVDNNRANLRKNSLYNYNQHLLTKHTEQTKASDNNYSSNTNNYSLQQQPVLPQALVTSPGATINPLLNDVASNNKINTSSLPAKNEKNNSADVNNNKTQLPIATKTAKSSVKIKNNNGHYFYTGLTAGADLSFVKYQQVQPVGYNAGLLVGYKFNKLSIESGLLLDKKNYSTAGEYFDKSKLAFFNNAKVLSVKGYCRMYEIPVNIKYDFSSRKKHTWFATAGLSSYLMNKEYYHYAYSENGMNHYGSYPYYHTTKNWFSIANLSAGYQLQTGAKTNFRAETYFKTTLGGVGTGNLSISSAGINLGITRRIP